MRLPATWERVFAERTIDKTDKEMGGADARCASLVGGGYAAITSKRQFPRLELHGWKLHGWKLQG